jgi:hypothetical protein
MQRSKNHRFPKVARSMREAFFAHSQSHYDSLLGPVERNGAAKLCGHAPVHQLAPKSLERYGGQDMRAAPFGPNHDYFIIIRVA